MTEYMKKSYHWFTIIELLGAIIMISVALLSILWLLRVAVTYTNKTRQETIAINLAREGIEWVYNRRNTNWLKRSGEKDKYRLCVDSWCTSWFQWWGTIHKLNYITTPYGKVSSYQPMGQITNDSILWDTSLLLSTGDFIWWTSPDAAGKFYRAIIGLGLYLKDSSTVWGDMITCADGNWNYNVTENCNDTTPKEYRFCSRVEYQRDLKWSVELCGSVTNYQE
jgi:type II secretory pathway pseudopilin PulG